MVARTYWETSPKDGTRRLVREWLDAKGQLAAWEVAATVRRPA